MTRFGRGEVIIHGGACGRRLVEGLINLVISRPNRSRRVRSEEKRRLVHRDVSGSAGYRNLAVLGVEDGKI